MRIKGSRDPGVGVARLEDLNLIQQVSLPAVPLLLLPSW